MKSTKINTYCASVQEDGKCFDRDLFQYVSLNLTLEPVLPSVRTRWVILKTRTKDNQDLFLWELSFGLFSYHSRIIQRGNKDLGVSFWVSQDVTQGWPNTNRLHLLLMPAITHNFTLWKWPCLKWLLVALDCLLKMTQRCLTLWFPLEGNTGWMSFPCPMKKLDYLCEGEAASS